ncbi:MAG: bifunctional demethylmenaquinone methyltransferase/2-methoxy-6-polyprenyl-1,4-benzoquinol methylase UbiE [Chitinivibrionales bacterium]|nr:bifunctional demethylmenaquinone methyltransferase/2-methoxy-6-polyprenyl-1,4-benzoquinol methylase UbiE [Chitinivibrionales bacterium]
MVNMFNCQARARIAKIFMSTACDDKNQSRRHIGKLFNDIAPTYDRLNHLLSLNIDTYWRKKMTDLLPRGESFWILDVATGTADVGLTIDSQRNRCDSIVGVDIAENMLRLAREKIAQKPRRSSISLVGGSATELPFANASFDIATLSFGLRNFSDVAGGLREINRILKPGGNLIVLEFSLPQNRVVRTMYLFYFRRILPLLGGAISGCPYAYSYLNKTAEAFPYGRRLVDIFAPCGYSVSSYTPLSLGIATLYVATK